MEPRRNQKITIKDIAQECKVSTQTVSRVLNNRPDVSVETRQRVKEVILRLGYRPSALARSLVKQNSFSIAVIIGDLSFFGVADVLNGIAKACEEAGYTLIVKELFQMDSPDIVPIVESLMELQVEGIIFAAPSIKENIRIAQSQLPAFCPPIIFIKCEPNPNYTTISIDNYGGARRAVEYLLDQGRHHIGLISGPLDWLEARQRKQGWEDALKAANIKIHSNHWIQGDWSSQGGEACFAELIQKYPEMDAVFSSNDQMALGVLHYANTNGVQIPRDLAVIGFDNIDVSAYFSPSLSTVAHPLHELGKRSVITLLDQIQAEPSARSTLTITLDTSLIIRDSAKF
ncbi:MAG: LacI family DNA-binding transcriptional regulator [Anaerolineaceae bacterium]